MSYIPGWFFFSANRDGRDLSVRIARQVFEDAIGADRVTEETMARWVRENMDILLPIIDSKAIGLVLDENRVVILPHDLDAARHTSAPPR